MENQVSTSKQALWVHRFSQLFGCGLIIYGFYVAFLQLSFVWSNALVKGIAMMILGSLYLVPWRRLQYSLWKRLFVLLLVLTFLFAFSLVFGVLTVFAEAAEAGIKPKMPMINSVLLFAVLIQPGIIFFARHPDWLD